MTETNEIAMRFDDNDEALYALQMLADETYSEHFACKDGDELIINTNAFTEAYNDLRGDMVDKFLPSQLLDFELIEDKIKGV